MRLLPLSLLALCALWFATGCERGGNLPFRAEDAEADFQRGKQLIRQGRNQEALAAFLKVISRRGDDAPESYLEAGLLYQQHIKDPIASIYYFRKFLELQPNSSQADLVRGRIDAAKREFARTLPAHPLEDASVKLQYMDQLERLQRENEQLKAEIADLRAAASSNATTPPPRPRAASANLPSPITPVSRTVPVAPMADSSPLIRPATSVDNRTALEKSPLQAPTTPRVVPPAATPPPATAGRRHVVQHGDTLSVISQRYYGTKGRWREIYAANRDVLKSENDRLNLGMELKIP